jgi:hypothetical protein
MEIKFFLSGQFVFKRTNHNSREEELNMDINEMDWSDSDDQGNSNLKRKRNSELEDIFEETDFLEYQKKLENLSSDSEEEEIIKEKEPLEEKESKDHSKITEKDKKQFGNFSGEKKLF